MQRIGKACEECSFSDCLSAVKMQLNGFRVHIKQGPGTFVHKVDMPWYAVPGNACLHCGKGAVRATGGRTHERLHSTATVEHVGEAHRRKLHAVSLLHRNHCNDGAALPCAPAPGRHSAANTETAPASDRRSQNSITSVSWRRPSSLRSAQSSGPQRMPAHSFNLEQSKTRAAAEQPVYT